MQFVLIFLVGGGRGTGPPSFQHSSTRNEESSRRACWQNWWLWVQEQQGWAPTPLRSRGACTTSTWPHWAWGTWWISTRPCLKRWGKQVSKAWTWGIAHLVWKVGQRCRIGWESVEAGECEAGGGKISCGNQASTKWVYNRVWFVLGPSYLECCHLYFFHSLRLD